LFFVRRNLQLIHHRPCPVPSIFGSRCLRFRMWRAPDKSNRHDSNGYASTIV